MSYPDRRAYAAPLASISITPAALHVLTGNDELDGTLEDFILLCGLLFILPLAVQKARNRVAKP